MENAFFLLFEDIAFSNGLPVCSETIWFFYLWVLKIYVIYDSVFEGVKRIFMDVGPFVHAVLVKSYNGAEIREK